MERLYVRVLGGVAIATLSCVTTLAATWVGAPSRDQVEQMIQKSEARTNMEISELKMRQEDMSKKMEQLLTKQIEVAVKLDMALSRR